MSQTEQMEKLLKRVEFGKYAIKKRFSDVFPELGAFEVEYNDYKKLQKIIELCDLCLKKNGIKEFDINKLPKKLRNMLVKAYYRALNRRIETLSEESKIFFMVDLHAKHIKIEDIIETVNVDDVVARWTQQIMLCVVSGYMGTGKTDFSLKVAEWLWLKGGVKYIIGNIGVNLKDSVYAPYYFEVSKLSELLKIIYRYKDSDKAFIFDEASIHISHRRAMSSKNNAITHLVKLIRKLKCHFIIISQRAEGIDKDLRELMTLHIHKEKKDRALVRELFGAEPQTYYIDFIEKTKIPFDTKDIADFEIDILSEDIPKIMRKVAENLTYEEFEEYIDELVKKKEEAENRKKGKDNNNGTTQDKKREEYINEDEKNDTNGNNKNGYLCRERKLSNEDKILLYLLQNGESKLVDIAKYIGRSRQRTHAIIQKMHERGLVYLKGVGRSSKWVITEAGKYYIEKVLKC